MKNNPLVLFIGLLASLGLFGVLLAIHQTSLADTLLLFTLVLGSIPLVFRIILSFARRQFGIDIIAITALVASGVLHQYLVGIIILLMLTTGEFLEQYAFRRARKEITALINKAPTIAHKKEAATFIDVALSTIAMGDTLMIRSHEIIPVDGIITLGETVIDESMITGESTLIEKFSGSCVMSGSLNQGGVIEIRATATSEQSQYEKILRLVKDAEKNEAPFVRMADAMSARFTLITFGFAFAAWWISGGDWQRVLAVLVVATPCPLILATPIAFASGISLAAKRGIIVKNGGALEQLSRAKSFVFDKTGTLTLGTPTLQFIDTESETPDEILRLAASLEQFSSHIIARAILLAAHRKDLTLETPEHFEETLGKGIRGTLNGTRYFCGSLSFLESCGIPFTHFLTLKHETSKDLGIMIVYLATDTGILGDIHFADTIRPETKNLFATLAKFGVKKIMMLTGDKEKTAKHIARQLGITAYRAQCLPEDKIRIINELKLIASPVIMVGDGINDAPALIAADMGIALGNHGNTVASDAGDIVIMVNTIERIGEAFSLAKRVIFIAKQGILLGIGLSILLMIFASLGAIPPVLGALLQEIIDALALLNALRVYTK